MAETGKLPRPVKIGTMLRWYESAVRELYSEPVKDGNQAKPQDEILFAVGTVARLLDCSTRSVHRWTDKGFMPRPLKIGAMVRWKASAIREWIADGCPDCQPAQLRAANYANAAAKKTVAKRSANDKRPA